jgi:hypothetical protein
MELFLWFWAFLIVWGCIWILFRPMYWTLLGGTAGFFIGKKIENIEYYKNLATELQEENIKLRKQLNDGQT